MLSGMFDSIVFTISGIGLSSVSILESEIYAWISDSISIGTPLFVTQICPQGQSVGQKEGARESEVLAQS